MKAIPFQPRWSKNVPRLPPGSAKQGTLDWRSNFNVQQLQRAPPIAPATSLQPRYSLVQREIEDEILLLPEGRNWAIVYSPMASGLLTGAMPCERATSRPKDDRRRGHADFTEPNVSQYGAGRAHAGDSQPPQALRRRSRNCLDAAPSRRAGAIVGARNKRQAEGVVRARELHLNQIEAFAETAAWPSAEHREGGCEGLVDFARLWLTRSPCNAIR